jgi:Tfp pilus assembly protein PilP
MSTYTDEQLALLIKLVAREQRYACVDAVNDMRNYLDGVRERVRSQIQKTPAPDVAEVIAEWRRVIAETNEVGE